MVSVDTRWFTPIAHEYIYGTTRNDPDSAMVELWIRPCPQSNTIHHDKFKRFKLVVALSWRLPNHHNSSRITTKLLNNSRWCITTALRRIMPVHHDLINRWIVALLWPKSWMCNWGFTISNIGWKCSQQRVKTMCWRTAVQTDGHSNTIFWMEGIT